MQLPPIFLLGLENDNVSLVSTLVASHQTNHVVTNSCDELNISTAKVNVQPTNIRSWKRIMCQANPTGATDTLDLEKKRKVSTCMASTLEFPYKRMQMLDDKVLSDLMVEATVQPRQKP